MMGEMSDALDVARFCWPTCEHSHLWGAEGVGFSCALPHDPCIGQFDSGDRDCIAAAERVLVERGLGEKYGRALAREMYPDEEAWMEGARFAVTTTWGIIGKIATAPLASRLRALARVARENPEAKT